MARRSPRSGDPSHPAGDSIRTLPRRGPRGAAARLFTHSGSALDRPPLRLFGTDYPTPDGTCIRDYIHVSDLAEAHVVALEALLDGHPTDCWNVGTGEGYSVRQVIDAVERVTGRTVPVVEAPRRPGDPPVLVAEAKKLKRLGWEPKYTELRAIVHTAWRWHNAALELVPSSQNRAI
uniref:GDP-mannose 4,6-dehydratase n=1 Tax=Calditerricola satsumensis TaxID=373054 RepID=UPI00277D0BD5|nr:GDP-mannose 4,6-dehydratase [Calditerricola satsumensis]